MTWKPVGGRRLVQVVGGTKVSPEEAARRIKEALKRESVAKFGTPDQWSK